MRSAMLWTGVGLAVLLPLVVFAQEFTFSPEYDSIAVQDGEYQIPAAWTGGYSESSPEFADIDADGDYDLFIGYMEGHIDFFENSGDPIAEAFRLAELNDQNINVSGSIYAGRSDPVFIDIDDDGDLDCFTSCLRGLVHYWENQGNAQSALFIWITDSLENIDVPGGAHLDFVDLDNDNDFDLLIGDNTGKIWYYQNIGTSQIFDFELFTSTMADIDVGDRASPCFVDIDADDDYDLFVGEESGHIWFYCNEGTAQQDSFCYVTNNWLGIDVGDYASPEFCDIDADGDYDLFIGKENSGSTPAPPGAIHFWENIGTPGEPTTDTRRCGPSDRRAGGGRRGAGRRARRLATADTGGLGGITLSAGVRRRAAVDVLSPVGL